MHEPRALSRSGHRQVHRPTLARGFLETQVAARLEAEQQPRRVRRARRRSQSRQQRRHGGDERRQPCHEREARRAEADRSGGQRAHRQQVQRACRAAAIIAAEIDVADESCHRQRDLHDQHDRANGEQVEVERRRRPL
jgi:hypothetical protein